MINDTSDQATVNAGSGDIWAETQPIHYDDTYNSYVGILYKSIKAKLASQTHHKTMMITPKITNASGETLVFDQLKASSEQFIIEAEDGVGKTFTLLTWAYHAILACLENTKRPLPIYAHIQNWDALAQLPLAYWLSTQIPLDPDTIQSLIDDGQVILLLDGLNDLTQKQRKPVTQEADPRQKFLAILPKNCTVILSNNDEALPSYLKNDIQALTLHPLNDVKIQSYLERGAHSEHLWEYVSQNTLLLEVVRKPLFLSMFVEAFPLDIVGKTTGMIEEEIFSAYVAHQYQITSQNHDTLAFSLEQIYTILGLVATRGVIRYGTGQIAMIEINQPDWTDLLIVDNLRFGFMGGETGFGDQFLEFAHQLNLITTPDKGMSSTFSHPIIRDRLVVKHCLPIEDKLDSYTIESLTRISDLRKYDAFATVLSGDFKLNFKLQAFAALENDSSDHALHTLLKLSQTLDHDFFSDRIKESISRRTRIA